MLRSGIALDNKNPGDVLREIRKEKKLSLFKAARGINISGNYLSEIERGKKKPSETVLFSISEFYGIDESELFKMYDLVVPDAINALKDMPELLKVLTKLSSNKKIKSEDLKDIAEELVATYEIIKNNKKQ